MKFKRLLTAALACVLGFGSIVGFTACSNDNDKLEAAADLTVTFWHPITGPDAEYMQKLIKNFNTEHEGKIFVKDSANAEDTHYTNISNSFNDNSSPDLALIHKSRVAYYEHNDKLRDMTALTQDLKLDSSLYVGDSWTACEFDGKMYAVPFDVLPTLLFYNRKLFPKDKAEAWEAEIRSEDFTIARMCEMMQEVYKHSSRAAQKTYGMAFNYSSTDSMFISFLNQQGENVLDESDPKTATYNSAAGVAAAETVKSIPDTKKDGNKVCSDSGSDHLNTYKQGRALFTIDGIWSAPGACDSTNSKVDTGVVRLPKMNAEATRNVSGDGHCFAMFNSAKNSMDDERKAAVAEFVQYLIDNSDYWCKGGKIAARSDIADKEEYKALEWGHISNELQYVISPVKVYTYNTIIDPIGKYVSDYVESKNSKTVQQALNDAVKDSNSKAAELN